jgi:hypothetical protein
MLAECLGTFLAWLLVIALLPWRGRRVRSFCRDLDRYGDERARREAANAPVGLWRDQPRSTWDC